ncbi:hypothetical protein QYM36_004272 [Artemia franciscana]|uniref:PI3K/PI4K catalytic domain-containing protein n=1 Tax=Artemia franciscana TaxID=6661 RepID=A0AA88LBQ7_ARTSF|nr:hypothetical protein QYM36_004272 [Artemia franciscana]
MVNVMGGKDSGVFKYFKVLILQGLIAARKHYERLLTNVEIMTLAGELQCSRSGAASVGALRNRFMIGVTDSELQNYVESMVESNLCSLSTRLYDGFQYFTNGIL